MSWDFYFWQDATEDDPVLIVEQLAEKDVTSVLSSSQVLDFRRAVLREWPELAPRLEPWHTDLEGTLPWGRTDIADRYVVLTLAWGWESQPQLVALAKRHDLRCYDPQISSFIAVVAAESRIRPSDEAELSPRVTATATFFRSPVRTTASTERYSISTDRRALAPSRTGSADRNA